MPEPLNTDPDSLPCAVVLTALRIEYTAVLEHIETREDVTHPRGDVYTLGVFRGPSGRAWRVAVAEVGQGQATAAAATERMIAHFKPQVAMFVGVAGGLKDVLIGDVVAATKVYGYERGKAATKFQPRPELFHSSFPLEERARAEAHGSNWLARIAVAVLPPSTPKAYVAPIAAGEKVISSERAEVCTFLRNNFTDSLAVEMEGGGFLEVLHRAGDVKGIVVRGISDLIENKHQAEIHRSQELAARHAAAFAFEILAGVDARGVLGSAGRLSPWNGNREFGRVAFALGGYRSGGIDDVLYEVARVEGLRVLPLADRERAAELLAREGAVGDELCLFVLCEERTGNFDVGLKELNKLRPKSSRFLVCCGKDDGRDAISCVLAGASTYLVAGRLGGYDACFRQIQGAVHQRRPYPRRVVAARLAEGSPVRLLLPYTINARDEFKRGILPAMAALDLQSLPLDASDPGQPELDASGLVVADVSSYRPGGVDPWVLSTVTSALRGGRPVLLVRRAGSAALPPELEALDPLEYNCCAELALKLYFGLRE